MSAENLSKNATADKQLPQYESSWNDLTDHESATQTSALDDLDSDPDPDAASGLNPESDFPTPREPGTSESWGPTPRDPDTPSEPGSPSVSLGEKQEQRETTFEEDSAKLQRLMEKADNLKAEIDQMGDNVKPGYQGAYEGTLGSIRALKSVIRIKKEQVPGYAPDEGDNQTK